MWHSSRAAMFVPVPSFLPPKRFPIPMVLVLTLLSEWRLFLFGRLLLCTARQLRAEPSPPLVKVSVFSFSFMSALLTFMLSLLCGCSHLHWIIFQHPLFLTGPSELPCQLRHTHWCSPPCFSYCRSAAEPCCREALCGWGSRYIRGRTGRFLFFCLNFWRFYSVFMNLYKKKEAQRRGFSHLSVVLLLEAHFGRPDQQWGCGCSTLPVGCCSALRMASPPVYKVELPCPGSSLPLSHFSCWREKCTPIDWFTLKIKSRNIAVQYIFNNSL